MGEQSSTSGPGLAQDLHGELESPCVEGFGVCTAPPGQLVVRATICKVPDPSCLSQRRAPPPGDYLTSRPEEPRFVPYQVLRHRSRADVESRPIGPNLPPAGVVSRC